jgi:tetratricopeptide (TPR) repeat protein
MKISQKVNAYAGILLLFAVLVMLPAWSFAGTREDLESADRAVKRGDYTEAIRLGTQIINSADLLPKGLAMVYALRGNAWYYKKEYVRAIEDYTKAIELDPKYTEGYYNLACIESLRKNTFKACAWLEKSILNGYDQWEQIKKDTDLDNIRTDECYKRIMQGK